VCREVSGWCLKLHCCTPGLVRASAGSTPYKGATSPIPIIIIIIIIIIIKKVVVVVVVVVVVEKEEQKPMNIFHSFYSVL